VDSLPKQPSLFGVISCRFGAFIESIPPQFSNHSPLRRFLFEREQRTLVSMSWLPPLGGHADPRHSHKLHSLSSEAYDEGLVDMQRARVRQGSLKSPLVPSHCCPTWNRTQRRTEPFQSRRTISDGLRQETNNIETCKVDGFRERCPMQSSCESQRAFFGSKLNR